MAQQVFAYIIHKNGVVDDTALEMITAAEKLNTDASVTAVIAGSGAELDGCATMLRLLFPRSGRSIMKLWLILMQK